MSDINQSSNPRLDEFDNLRGLAIIGVVIIHATAPFLREVELNQYSQQYLYDIFLFINQTQIFCVPVFIIISVFFYLIILDQFFMKLQQMAER